MGGDANRNMSVSKDYPQLAAGPVGKQIHSIYQSRLRQFTDGGQYREQGLLPYVHRFLPSKLTVPHELPIEAPVRPNTP